MRIDRIEEYLSYYARIRERTERVIAVVPDEHYDWSYKEGKFTIADIIRHIANIERWVYVECVLGRPAAYRGCGKAYADAPGAVRKYLRDTYQESTALLSTLSEAYLQKKVLSATGQPITCWKWLRALTEHEIHHRAQLYIYIGMLGVETPPIFGSTSEKLIVHR